MPTVVHQPQANTDDAVIQYVSGATWYFGDDANECLAGWANATYSKMGSLFRFPGVQIPSGATIQSAILQLTSTGAWSTTVVRTRVSGHRAANSSTVADIADYQSRRGTVVGGPNNNNVTVAQIAWDGVPTTSAETVLTSPNLSSLIQEIVNLPGWTLGNAISLFWDDHEDRTTHVSGCYRTIYPYNRSPSKSAKLTVTFTPADPILVMGG